jgi:Flp pilus assembly protein TadB
MNQQEFASESDGHRWQDQDKAKQASRYYRKRDNGLKEEHPSTFEDTVPPYVYRAQDSLNASSSEETQARQRLSNTATSDRDHRSHARNQQQQQTRVHQRMKSTRPGSGQRTSPWQNPILRWAILILLVFALIHILPFVVMVVLSILGVLAVALLLPFFIVLGLVAAVVIVVLVVLAMLGIPISSRRRSRYFHR